MNTQLANLAVAPVEERLHLRRIVDLAASLRELGCVASDVTVQNVSRFGCLVTGCDMAEGAEIWLKLPGCNPSRARVVWVSEGKAGCEFYRPVDDAALAAGRVPVRQRKSHFELRR